MKKAKTPKVPFRVIKVQRPIVPHDGPWLLYSEDGEVYEYVEFPDPWLKEALSGRLKGYFMGRRSVDGGWEWKGRYKGAPLYW